MVYIDSNIVRLHQSALNNVTGVEVTLDDESAVINVKVSREMVFTFDILGHEFLQAANLWIHTPVICFGTQQITVPALTELAVDGLAKMKMIISEEATQYCKNVLGSYGAMMVARGPGEEYANFGDVYEHVGELIEDGIFSHGAAFIDKNFPNTKMVTFAIFIPGPGFRKTSFLFSECLEKIDWRRVVTLIRTRQKIQERRRAHRVAL